MSLPANWRQLQLFEVLPIRDPNSNTSDLLYSNPSLIEVAASKAYLVLAVDQCFLKIVSHHYTTLKYFMAYEPDYSISFMALLPDSNTIVTIAEKQGFPAILKLWDLDRLVALDEPDLSRKFITEVMVRNGDNSFPLSCFAFNHDFSCLAVGYTNGKVVLIRGDLLRDRGSKQRLVYELIDPITGLHFNEYHELLYVTTTSRILTVPTTGRNQGKPQSILSRKIGVPLQCSVLDPETQELIVGIDSSVRYYNHISKSHVVNFEISKKLLFRYKSDYLLMICPIEEGTVNNRKLTTRVLVIDLNYKHISFSLTIPNTSINHVFEMWGDIYLLSNDGMLYRLHEKPVNQQVELILQKEVFNLAYQLAKNSGLPLQTLLRICKLHGDFLYNRQDFEDSIKCYIKCLKYYKDEPETEIGSESLNDFIMNIITKFKDGSNIKDLTEFLYQLYKLGLANNDHITLLLCCYCKLKMVDKIRLFIDEISKSAQENDDNTPGSEFMELDYLLIINLFKECGYYDEVIRLLYELNRPNLIVDIQLNDSKDPRNCLKYIKSLSIDELLLILIEHSKTLLDNAPIETTELLINVFTGKYVPSNDSKILEFNDTPVKSLYNHPTEEGFPLNSYKSFLAYLSGAEIEDDHLTLSSANENSQPTYLPPRPSLIFPSFINNPNEFVIFLEACIETFDKYQGSINDKKELLITLVEMYLSLAKKQEDSRDQWVQKAQSLVQDYTELFDKSSLSLISHIYDFKIDLALSDGGFDDSLFRTAQLNGDVAGCFDIVEKHGSNVPELYKALLRFVISKKQIFDQVDRKQFNFIIDNLKDKKLASPLEIIQILSSSEFTTIGLIRDYLIEVLDITNQEIKNNSKLVEHYEKESIKSSYQITELETKPFIIQNNKCSACNLKLDFPVIHFKCKHSFHQRCLNDNYISSNELINSKPTCSICISDVDLIQTLRDEQLKSKDETQLFEANLKEATDKFRVITNYIGKGIMEEEYVSLDNDL